MDKKTRAKLDRICVDIEPFSREVDTPYRCGSVDNCFEIFEYAGKKYCGRILRALRNERSYVNNTINDLFSDIE